MEPTVGSLLEQRTISSAVVSGKWDRGIHLFFLAKKGVSGLEGSPGGNLRGGAGSGVPGLPQVARKDPGGGLLGPRPKEI